MILQLPRQFRYPTHTISPLSINGTFIAWILEDTDRGLRQDMTLKQIQKIKVKGKTSIPTGRYRIVISYSPRFKRYLPEILNVPGYEGIRIHAGNTAADTDGCLLPGTEKTNNSVLYSRTAFNIILNQLTFVERTEEIWIDIS